MNPLLLCYTKQPWFSRLLAASVADVGGLVRAGTLDGLQIAEIVGEFYNKTA